MLEEDAWIRQLISGPSYGPWAMRSSELAGTARSVCGTRPPNGCSDFAADEALGRSLDLIIPERFRNRLWEGYQQVMRTGQTKYGTEVLRVPALHKDKRTLSIAFTVALLCSSDNEIQMIVAIVRDETTRWKEDRALRQRLTELEAAIQMKTSAAPGRASSPLEVAMEGEEGHDESRSRQR